MNFKQLKEKISKKDEVTILNSIKKILCIKPHELIIELELRQIGQPPIYDIIIIGQYRKIITTCVNTLENLWTAIEIYYSTKNKNSFVAHLIETCDEYLTF